MATIRSFSTGVQEGSNSVLTKPTGTASGDLLVAIMSTDETPSNYGTPPSGFEEVSRSSFDSARPKFIVWSKVAGGAEPTNYTFSVGGAFMSNAVWLYAIQDLPASYSLVADYAAGTSTSCTAPSITTATHGGTNPLLMTAHAAIVEYSDSTFSTPTGMTARGGRLDAQWTNFAGFSISLSGAVDTGARTSTLSASEPWRACSLALVENAPTFTNRGLFLPF